MTNEQIKLVQDSFRQVAPIAETAAQLFYARLFELDPDLAESSVKRYSQLQAAVQPFAHVASGKDLSLTLRVADSVPDRVVGDAFRLRQVLHNLIGNAVKFTHQGGVTVEVERAPTPGRRGRRLRR